MEGTDAPTETRVQPGSSASTAIPIIEECSPARYVKIPSIVIQLISQYRILSQHFILLFFKKNIAKLLIAKRLTTVFLVLPRPKFHVCIIVLSIQPNLVMNGHPTQVFQQSGLSNAHVKVF
jgi:hypothetical protein